MERGGGPVSAKLLYVGLCGGSSSQHYRVYSHQGNTSLGSSVKAILDLINSGLGCKIEGKEEGIEQTFIAFHFLLFLSPWHFLIVDSSVYVTFARFCVTTTKQLANESYLFMLI